MGKEGNYSFMETTLTTAPQERVGKEDVLKLMTQDLSHFSFELQQKITFATSFISNFLLESSGGRSSSEEDTAVKVEDKEESNEAIEVIEDEEDDGIMKKILALSEDKINFLESPEDKLEEEFDYEKFAPFALDMLRQDERLNKMRYKLVPKMVQEEHFWNNYFSRVQIIKQGAHKDKDLSPKEKLEEASLSKKELGDEASSREVELEDASLSKKELGEEASSCEKELEDDSSEVDDLDDGFHIIDAEEVKSHGEI